MATNNQDIERMNTAWASDTMNRLIAQYKEASRKKLSEPDFVKEMSPLITVFSTKFYVQRSKKNQKKMEAKQEPVKE